MKIKEKQYPSLEEQKPFVIDSEQEQLYEKKK